MEEHTKQVVDSNGDSKARNSSPSVGVARRTKRRRGNAEGTIYRRGDGRWVAAVTDPRTGRQRCWYAKTRAEAGAKLNSALRARDDGLRLSDPRQTVGDFLKRWEQEVARPTLMPSTLVSYASLLRQHLIPSLGNLQLGKLGPEHVQAPLGRNAEVQFHGEHRTNDTHASTTDPEARLYRKSNNTAATLCFTGHLLMENRNALIIDAELTTADGYAERSTAIEMLARLPKSARRRSVAGDKGYDTKSFVTDVRGLGFTPHVAPNTRYSAIDGRTTRHRVTG